MILIFWYWLTCQISDMVNYTCRKNMFQYRYFLNIPILKLTIFSTVNWCKYFAYLHFKNKDRSFYPVNKYHDCFQYQEALQQQPCYWLSSIKCSSVNTRTINDMNTILMLSKVQSVEWNNSLPFLKFFKHYQMDIDNGDEYLCYIL